MSDTYLNLLFALLTGFIVGVIFGGVLNDTEWRKVLFERGHMVECIGKEGYFWECEQ